MSPILWKLMNSSGTKLPHIPLVQNNKLPHGLWPGHIWLQVLLTIFYTFNSLGGSDLRRRKYNPTELCKYLTILPSKWPIVMQKHAAFAWSYPNDNLCPTPFTCPTQLQVECSQNNAMFQWTILMKCVVIMQTYEMYSPEEKSYGHLISDSMSTLTIHRLQYKSENHSRMPLKCITTRGTWMPIYFSASYQYYNTKRLPFE